MTDKEPRLGCKAFELEPGMEFSFDEGFSWVVCVTNVDAPEDDSNDSIINYRRECGCVETLRVDGYTHVLLERNWPKKQ